MLKFVSISAIAICLASASADGPVTDQCYLETPPGNEPTCCPDPLPTNWDTYCEYGGPGYWCDAELVSSGVDDSDWPEPPISTYGYRGQYIRTLQSECVVQLYYCNPVSPTGCSPHAETDVMNECTDWNVDENFRDYLVALCLTTEL